jgi:hypothetical protein
MRFAAAALGWRLRLLDRVDDAALSRLFGLDREVDYGDAEREHAELLAVVVREEVTEKSPTTALAACPWRCWIKSRILDGTARLTS